ncbi:MAG: homocysteine S-methyltransferase family protein [Microcoleus sp.]
MLKPLLSHAELNESETLDEGNPTELGNQYGELRVQFPQISILGGCCGTDDRHVEAICQACFPVLWTHISDCIRLKSR